MTDPKETLAALGERLLGIIGAAYAHARQMPSGGNVEADRVEGRHMQALLRRGQQLHEEYRTFLLAQVEEAKKPKETKK